jgi:hypothetical protein
MGPPVHPERSGAESKGQNARGSLRDLELRTGLTGMLRLRLRRVAPTLWLNGGALLLLISSSAHAWPVDVAVTVTNGDVHFERPAAIDWAEVDDPKIATVEVLQTGELLFTGKQTGHTYALLFAEGKPAVWRIDVLAKGAQLTREASPAAKLDPARKACKDVSLGEPGTDSALTATVPNDVCRKALLELFQTPAFLARELSLTFELDALQAQLKDVTDAIAKNAHVPVDAHYLGAGLVLKGQVTVEQHRKILWEVFRHTAGRIALDDQLEVAPPPDAGSPEDAKP